MQHSKPPHRGNPHDHDARDSEPHANKVRRGRRSKHGKPIIPIDKLRGKPVVNPEGDQLGMLGDLMIEPNQGVIAYVLITFDNKKSFALPYSMLRIDPESLTIEADVQREVFELGRGMMIIPNACEE